MFIIFLVVEFVVGNGLILRNVVGGKVLKEWFLKFFRIFCLFIVLGVSLVVGVICSFYVMGVLSIGFMFLLYVFGV